MAATSKVRNVSRFPETFLTLRLSASIQPEAVQWLVYKITGSKEKGGGELLVRCQPFHMRKKEGFVLHVTARPAGFLENAEYLEMKKIDVHGHLRDFHVLDLDSFLQGGNRHGDEDETSILTAAEKQVIVRHGLKNIRAVEGETYVPGYPEIELFTGQAVLQVYLRKGLITDFFPLHNQKVLARFKKTWYYSFSLWKDQPIAAIRTYFGDSIALYYTAASAYTDSLVIPLLVSSLVWGIGWLSAQAGAYAHLLHCLFNVVWVTTCLEVWKQRSATLAFNWGTLRMFRMEEPRLYFHGDLVMDPITCRLQRRYPRWKRNLKVAVSWFIVTICLAGAVFMLFDSIKRKEAAADGESYSMNTLSFLYVLAIQVMKFCFKKLATFLTDWENHRTDTKYQFHRVAKLVCFELVNNFFSLFYMAFYIQDFEMLKVQIRTLLILHGFCQIGFPFVIEQLKKFWRLEILQLFRNHAEIDRAWMQWPLNRLGIHALPPDDPRIEAFKREVPLHPFQDTFDDYLEMWLQFGYVYFFSPIYPMGILWALVSNIIELRTDAYKLCHWFQRPFAKRVENIGAWQPAFELMGIIAVLCNCGLLALKLREHMPAWLSEDHWLYFIVGFEHLLILIVLFLKFNISGIPSKIKIKFARQELESRKALRVLQHAIRSGTYRRSMETLPTTTSENSIQTVISQMGMGTPYAAVRSTSSRSAEDQHQEFFTPESGTSSAVVILKNRRRNRDMAL